MAASSPIISKRRAKCSDGDVGIVMGTCGKGAWVTHRDFLEEGT